MVYTSIAQLRNVCRAIVDFQKMMISPPGRRKDTGLGDWKADLRRKAIPIRRALTGEQIRRQ